METTELQDLVQRAQGGDLRAYARLVESTQAMVYAVARRVLRDREAARDAAQETYLRMFRRLKDLRDPLAFPGWLRRVAATGFWLLPQNQKAHEVTRDVTAWAWAAGLPFGRPLSGGSCDAPILVSDRFFGNLLPGLGPPRSTQRRRRV